MDTATVAAAAATAVAADAAAALGPFCFVCTLLVTLSVFDL